MAEVLNKCELEVEVLKLYFSKRVREPLNFTLSNLPYIMKQHSLLKLRTHIKGNQKSIKFKNHFPLLIQKAQKNSNSNFKISEYQY